MKGLVTIVGIVILLVFAVILVPFLTQWAWSHSMTPVFGARQISWLEAFAFNMLLSGGQALRFNRKK